MIIEISFYTGIIDENNNLVVEYNYDGYGNIISMVDNTTNKIGEKNPYRYRSYYYDTETIWYYLNSRYYNPNIGRFITMDEIEYLGATSTILSYNLFTYCEGNPVVIE
jgi:RHS repeat-associated protein